MRETARTLLDETYGCVTTREGLLHTRSAWSIYLEALALVRRRRIAWATPGFMRTWAR